MNLGREIAPAAVVGRPGFRLYPGPVAGAILAIPFAGVAVWGFTTFRGALSPGFSWFIAACAGLMVLLSLVTTAFWLRFGVTLSLHELGVVLNGHEIPYAEIDSLTVRDRRRFDDNALTRALVRTVTIAAGGRTVKAQFLVRPWEALDPMLDHIAARAAAAPRPRAGKGWRIEQGTFVARRERVPLSEISAAGVFERDVRLWRHREEEHFFAVRYQSKNARVLLALVGDRAAEIAPEPEPTQGAGIGRLLFARRTTFWSVLGNAVIALFILGLAWMALERYLGLDMELAIGIAVGGAVLWMANAIYRRSVHYRFHERAVVRSSALGTRTLAYANAASMKWGEAGITFEHMIPMGLTVRGRLVPDDGSRPLTIILHAFRVDDPDLLAVRNAISAHIAENMHRRVLRGERVPWTSKAMFTPEGLVVKGEILPYDGSVTVHFHDGWLMFFRGNDTRRPFALLSASDENFYPGWMLFQSAADREEVRDQSAR